MKIKNQRTHLRKLFTIPKHELTKICKDYVANRDKTDEVRSTANNYRLWYVQFRKFIFDYNKRDVILDNKGVALDYMNWMLARKLANGYIKKHLVIFQTVLNHEEIVHGIHIRNLMRNFARPDRSNDDWFMTEKEVKQLLKVKWPVKRERLILHRFLIACFTGCRKSDIDNLEILDDKTLQYECRKNRKAIKIPFSDHIKPYLMDDDFKYGVILNTSDRKNEADTLRKIFKSLGWTQMVKKYRLVGKKKTMYKIHRYDAIRFHSARKWYGKMLLDMDVPMYKVSQLLGHSSIIITQQTYASLSREKMIGEVNDLINKF